MAAVAHHEDRNSSPPSEVLGEVEPIADRVRRTMPSLTTAERKVARRLLAQQATAGLETLAVLATKASVSGPTVTRFIKKLGFPDYAAFQSAIRAEINARMVSPVDLLRAGGGEHVGLQRYSAGMSEGVRHTLNHLVEHEFETSCALLATVRSPVITMGGWTSSVLARHLATQLQQIRRDVHYAGQSSSDVSAMVADAGPRHTAVVFDLRRYEQRTIQLSQALRRRSVRIILVTDTWLSPVAELADLVLPASVETGLGFDSLVPAMAIAEALVDRTAQLLGDTALEQFQEYNSFSMAIAPRWQSDHDHAVESAPDARANRRQS